MSKLMSMYNKLSNNAKVYACKVSNMDSVELYDKSVDRVYHGGIPAVGLLMSSVVLEVSAKAGLVPEGMSFMQSTDIFEAYDQSLPAINQAFSHIKDVVTLNSDLPIHIKTRFAGLYAAAGGLCYMAMGVTIDAAIHKYGDKFKQYESLVENIKQNGVGRGATKLSPEEFKKYESEINAKIVEANKERSIINQLKKDPMFDKMPLINSKNKEVQGREP